jgi:catechol 2,3-dioxygenase-like lactoylglutathione lyase family enzyme
MTGEGKEPRLGYIYNHCNDIEVMRWFYTNLLGLKDKGFHSDENWGYLCYLTGGLELMFFRTAETIPVQDKWAVQPGWDGGTFEGTSWSVLIPEEEFAAVVKKLISAGVKTFAQKPMWLQDCYWGYPVMDPMGNTVEVYTTPKEKPTNTEWQD